MATGGNLRDIENLDIYTREPMEKPSMEHVIHNFLGGSLEGLLIDQKLNSQFGDGIDTGFCNALRPYITRLDLRSNREKKRPPPAMEFTPEPNKTADDRFRWALQPGGVPEIVNVERKIDITTIDGGVQISAYIVGGAALTEERMAEVIWAAVSRNKDLPEDKRSWLQANKEAAIAKIRESVAAEHQTEVKPIVVRTPLNILSPVFLRSVAKIACNYFAYCNRAAFLDDSCNLIREYVLHGQGVGRILLVSGNVPETGAIRHGVAFQVHDDGEVVSSVTLFGTLHFLVSIGHVPVRDGLRRKSMYVVNQVELKSEQMIPAWDLPPFNFEMSLEDSASAVGLSNLRSFVQIVEVASFVYSMSKEADPEKAAIKPLVERLAQNLFLNNILVPPKPVRRDEDDGV